MKTFLKFFTITVAAVLLIVPVRLDAGIINISVGTGGGNVFSPSSVAAVAGDTIVWTWVSGVHNVVSTSVPTGAKSFTSPISGQAGFQYTYIIEVPGTYNYVCELHFGMNGTIIAEPSSVTQQNNEIPESFVLMQNFPNPFNPETKINFSIPVQSKVLLTVHNITGQEVARLVNQELSAGNFSVYFYAAAMSSGAYFYRIQAGEFSQTRKMILVR